RELLDLPIAGPAMAKASTLPPDAHGLTMLPFVAGERSPGWHDGATGVIAGLTLATRPEDLVRAAMEAVAYRFGRIFDRLRPLSPARDDELEIVANGGAIVNSPVWLQIVADVLGHPIIALPAEDEATARGAAIVAQIAAGILPDLAAAADPAGEATLYTPDPDRHQIYQAGRGRQVELEATLYPQGFQ
ncbi:MAG: FGGY-family carbohydrate kinase, partial [Chloroflexota bacterium]|nr:FGGY-family carbohydrate kinase [Chloroflexota bacterium]